MIQYVRVKFHMRTYPYPKVVKRINELYDEDIISLSQRARGKWSGENWFEFTEGQLKEWGVKYHERLVKNRC